MLFEQTVTEREVRVCRLPQAALVNLSVTALAGDLEAETVTIASYTGNRVLVLSCSIANKNFLCTLSQRWSLQFVLDGPAPSGA